MKTFLLVFLLAYAINIHSQTISSFDSGIVLTDSSDVILKNTDFCLYDLSGKIVDVRYSITGNRVSVYWQSLSSGVYLLRTKSEIFRFYKL